MASPDKTPPNEDYVDQLIRQRDEAEAAIGLLQRVADAAQVFLDGGPLTPLEEALKALNSE